MLCLHFRAGSQFICFEWFRYISVCVHDIYCHFRSRLCVNMHCAEHLRTAYARSNDSLEQDECNEMANGVKWIALKKTAHTKPKRLHSWTRIAHQRVQCVVSMPRASKCDRDADSRCELEIKTLHALVMQTTIMILIICCVLGRTLCSLQLRAADAIVWLHQKLSSIQL